MEHMIIKLDGEEFLNYEEKNPYGVFDACVKEYKDCEVALYIYSVVHEVFIRRSIARIR